MLDSSRVRLISFLTGAGAAGCAYVLAQRSIWGSASQLIDRIPGSTPPAEPLQPPELLLGPRLRQEAIKTWNEGVDYVFGGLARELAKRGL